MFHSNPPSTLLTAIEIYSLYKCFIYYTEMTKAYIGSNDAKINHIIQIDAESWKWNAMKISNLWIRSGAYIVINARLSRRTGLEYNELYLFNCIASSGFQWKENEWTEST